MQQLLNAQFPKTDTFQYFLKPILDQDSLFAGSVGTRRVATFLGVNDGDPLASFTVPDAVIAARSTTAQIDAGTNTPFGSPSSSKSTWALKAHEVRPRIHSQTVTDDVGLTNQDPKNGMDRGKSILDVLVSKYGQAVNMDLHRHAFWSHTTFDPDTDYSSPAHAFENETANSMSLNDGFLPLIKDALDAAKFSNYKTTSGTGGIDVDGATLTTANAAILVKKIVSQASRKLKMLNYGEAIEKKPYGLLSHDLYERFKEYLAEKYTDSTGYTLYAYGKDGSIDLNSPMGLRYDGFAFYNAGNLFDAYWDLTNKTGKDYQHMGMLTARENLSLGLNLKNPVDANVGMSIYQLPNPKDQGAVDLSLFLQADYLIGDDTLFSTVGFEQLP